MSEQKVDAVEAFKASRILGPDGLPYISNGFSREKLDLEGINYFSAPRAKKLVESPKHYEWKYILGNREPETPAKLKGRLLHWALLQPKEFLSRYIVEPKFKGKGMKAAKADWKKALPKNAIVVGKKDAEDIYQMIQSLHSHPRASKLLSNGTPEVHAFYTDHEFKDEQDRPLLWYGIMDFYRSGNWIAEVKTTKSAKRWEFSRDCYKFGHHIQTWKYKRMVQGITGKPPESAIIALEHTAPYNVEIYHPTTRWMEHANYEVTLAIRSRNECMQSGIWHGYSKDPQPLDVPAFSKSRFDDDEGTEE